MANLDGLLNAMNSSADTRRWVFQKLYGRNYFPGMTPVNAAIELDRIMASDSPQRQHLLSAGLPYFNQDRRLANKMVRSAGVGLAGLLMCYVAVSSPKENKVLNMLGPLCAGFGGIAAAYYGVSRRFV